MAFEQPLPVDAEDAAREERYRALREQLAAVLEDESDWVAAMSTVACHLHRAFDYFDWTGFYRHVEPEMLVVGPYQGPSGCLRIPFSQGICGAAARRGTTEFVEDVSERPDHIACSTTTQSEIVVPIVTPDRSVAAVLDVDSDELGAFSGVDRDQLEVIADQLSRSFDLEVPDV